MNYWEGNTGKLKYDRLLLEIAGGFGVVKFSYIILSAISDIWDLAVGVQNSFS